MGAKKLTPEDRDKIARLDSQGRHSDRYQPSKVWIFREIEDRFLQAINGADFLYMYTQNRYVGDSAAFEVGYALGIKNHGLPIYTSDL